MCPRQKENTYLLFLSILFHSVYSHKHSVSTVRGVLTLVDLAQLNSLPHFPSSALRLTLFHLPLSLSG